MPRKPGRGSTRKTISIEHSLISSFALPWEDRYARQPCCITGCEHQASGEVAVGEYCASDSLGLIVDERLMPGPKPDPYVGAACPCCVNKIHEYGNSLIGDPPSTGCHEPPPF